MNAKTFTTKKNHSGNELPPTSKETDLELIDDYKPLSQSLIWKLQSDFYANQGPDAWRKGIVPQYITTNPFIANLYAKTVFGYCRDLVSSSEYQGTDTLYIVELAAGIGRFTYTFLKRFLELLDRSSFPNLKFKYIITDFAKTNVDYWLNHEYLKAYFEEGILDCACFDMSRDDTLRLCYSGEILGKGTAKQPAFLFANYAFDSLPQDTFYVSKGSLYEGRIRLSKQQGESSIDSSILANLEYDYMDQLVDSSSYYEEANFNEILSYYENCLEDTAFSIPIVSLRCIQRIREIFQDDLLILTADKGYRNLSSLEQIYHPVLSKHGSISLMVNLHGIELYFNSIGGHGLHSIFDNDNVTLSLFQVSNRTHHFIESNLAFEEIVETMGPDDFYSLKKAIIPNQKLMTSKELLTFLRYSNYDARTFLELYNTFLERIAEEENFPRKELLIAIHQVWDHYFPIGEEENLPYCLGSVLAYFGYDQDAIFYYEASMAYHGEDASIHYEIALCYYNMENLEMTLSHLEKSLSYDSDYEESLTLKAMLLPYLD